MSTQSRELNYHHLYHFWCVAREGNLSRAAAKLRISHSTLSTQIGTLEKFLGQALFQRNGRAITLTLLGRDVLSYADEIFRTGNELVEVARSNQTPGPTTLRIGLAGSIPKAITDSLLGASTKPTETGRTYLRQDSLEPLLDELTAGQLHVVVSSRLPPQGTRLTLFVRLLNECIVWLYGTPSLAQRYAAGFPDSLADAPLLVPAAGSRLRLLVDHWFAHRNLRVRTIGEFADAATMRAFGLEGLGLFPMPVAHAADLAAPSAARPIGKLDGVDEQFYALLSERRVRSAELKALLERTRQRLLTRS